MSSINKIKQSQVFLEYQKNPRLQWMVLGIVLILALSAIKQFAVQLQSQLIQTQSQLDLLARLQKTSEYSVDPNTSKAISDSYSNLIEQFPTAPSSSVAEAQALAKIEQTLGKLLKNKRLNLLGSEQLSSDNQIYWQVRIEIMGQLNELNLIEALQYFDKTHKNVRITSFQYSPKTSNAINFVVDFLFKRTEDA
jgi:hypothetical protein